MKESRVDQLLSELETQPDDPFLHHALGVEYLKAEKVQQAHKCFSKALEKDPAYLGSYFQLGKTYELMGLFDKALRTYMKGMNIAHDQGDRHTYSELRQAYEFLEEELEE